MTLSWAEEPATPHPAADPAAASEEHQFFENKIRPILSARCFSCHGGEKTNGELRLDSLQGMLEGGESGPALVPGKPDESLVVSAVSYDSLEMPPAGKLPDAEISLLVEWVRRGAVWPGAVAPKEVRSREMEISASDRQFWSFVPPKRTPVPTPSQAGRAQTPIDLFLQFKQEAAGLSMSGPAPRRVLLRRAAIDLTGLAPTMEEVASFEQDARPDAYERRVDQWLASPRHGERWGRHWLDVVRYAQTDGYERDSEKPESWRYRDYVIGSINADKPYDQFLREQLAGDELDQVTDETLIATGFGRLGVWDDEPDDKANAEFEHYDDLVSTVGQSMLGLTIGCARCHDHKFDPIPQRDYYGLVAFFRGVQQNERFDAKKKEFTNLVTLSTGERTLAMREGGPQPAATHVLVRGDAHTPGAAVEPHFVEVLSPSAESTRAVIATRDANATSSGRRRVLAEWVASADHPLTARVMVNRVWHHHFGRGIVATPSDFGKTGSLPTHPELLDWLAMTFSHELGWEMKGLHRLLVESAAYRQSSVSGSGRGAQVDPGNELVWRQRLHRLDAESMRDGVLLANERINLEMGGRGFFPRLPKEVLATQSIPGNGWGESPASQADRRSLYMFVKRTLRVPMLETFDAATPDQSIAARNVTTVAPQALVWLNSDFMEEQSLAMADLLLSRPGDDRERLAILFARALQRLPEPAEENRLLAFLTANEKEWSALSPASEQVNVIDRWSRFGGDWSERPEGGIGVVGDDGAKLIWPTGLITSGNIEAEVMLQGDQGNAGLIFRVVRPYEGVNALVGYYLGLSPTQVILGKHQDSYAQLTAVERTIARDIWHHVRIELTGPRMRVWLDREETPVVDIEDAAIADPGQVGFRTYQMPASFRQLKVKSEQGEWRGVTDRASLVNSLDQRADARRRAWADVARIVFNTNEFVYVD
jgi:mono/diheme cytochrome c family protein